MQFEARPGRRVPMALSIGAAVYPYDGDTYEALLATGDSRMYHDKTRRKQVRDDLRLTGTDGRVVPAMSRVAGTNAPGNTQRT
jgi:GGDEF domain-containing protein